MEETILYPSPNWFLPSVLAVSKDGWLIYGGPGKTLIVLEPLSPNSGGVVDSKYRHKTHILNRIHKDRVVSVSISPKWPENRQFVSGSSDGCVKVWSITQVDNKFIIKNTYSHEIHSNDKEEIVSVGYSKASYIVSVGNFSNITVWELNTNATKTFNLIKSFKATCMSCSPHIELVVAIGTKQGVVFVLDLNTPKGSILYKVRGQDDEVGQVVWCPQYEVIVKRTSEVKKSAATARMEKIRNEPEPSNPDTSGINKTLPDDSFNESVVKEDDMFDIYKDHEADEFGHKKYEPEQIVVKKKEENAGNDFLAECERLKAQILKNKQEDEEPIANLVEAMDKAHIEAETKNSQEAKPVTGVAAIAQSGSTLVSNGGSDHIHKHLLASISKQGSSLRIWAKTGKLVASCVVLLATKGKAPDRHSLYKYPHYACLCWYKPDCLIISDGKAGWVDCNPLQVDYKNKLRWELLPYMHRRNLYCIATTAPRIQTKEILKSEIEDDWCVWTAAQDRLLIKYSIRERKMLAKYDTCGGAIYDVRPCPYDAGKLSVSVGDGAVRIWQTQTSGEDENMLVPGEVTYFWQNVQGKILQTAWHPTKENLLAFATAESRVGLIDISNPDRYAKVLPSALRQGVYSLVWGDNMTLFAVGGSELVMYQANKPDQVAIPIHIEIDGQKWDPCVVNYSPRGLAVASCTGGVALFSGPGGHALAAKFVYTRLIHAIEWHPIQTSSSDVQSEYKGLLAVSSADREYNIEVLKYEDKEGSCKAFSNFITLSGHTNFVLQIYWNPHRDGQLLSTSLDQTVRVWDVIRGECVSVFTGHTASSLGATWSPHPQLADKVLSGSSDCALRLWDINDYPASAYTAPPKFVPKKRSSRRRKNSIKFDDVVTETVGEILPGASGTANEHEINDDTNDHSDEEGIDFTLWLTKPSKKYIAPILARQLGKGGTETPRAMLLRYHECYKDIESILELANPEMSQDYDFSALKLFGSNNDFNEVLDRECAGHLQLHSHTEYIMLMIFRGHVDTAIQYAHKHDMLDAFLLSIAPSVSLKYWKDTMQLYANHLDRLAAKPVTLFLPPTIGQMDDDSAAQAKAVYRARLLARDYGGPTYRKAAALLSLHDVRGAVTVLEKATLFKEAYILCRCRHMDSIAKEVLMKWTHDSARNGDLALCAVLHIVMGNSSAAAHVLRRSHNVELLNLAAELAKAEGHNTFADYIETKTKTVEPHADPNTEEDLAELPSKIELLLKENKVQNGDAHSGDEEAKLPSNIELCNQVAVQNGESNKENEVVNE